MYSDRLNHTILRYIQALALLVCMGLGSHVQANVTNAASWLQKNQLSGGEWGGAKSSSSELVTTSAVLEAFVLTSRGSSTIHQKGLAYLAKQKAVNAGDLARRILATATVNGAPTAADVTALLALQNKDGGFATFKGHQSNILDTAIVLQALSVSGTRQLTVVQKAIGYILSKQHKDGGWLFFSSANDSSPYLTGHVLMALSGYNSLYNLKTNVDKAIQFLKTKQATDGSWGKGRDQAMTTSLAVLGLLIGGNTTATLVAKAVSLLQKKQDKDGSFHQDPFATAYAMRALDAQKPDILVLASQAKITPAPLVLGSKTTIELPVRNQGALDAKNVEVQLSLGDPNTGKSTVIGKATLASLPAGQTAKVTFNWSKALPKGTIYLTFLVDPTKAIKESNERNNSATISTQIVPPLDLAVLKDDLTLRPLFPTPNKSIEFHVRVRNQGGLEAKNVEVAFYLGNPSSGGKLIGTAQTIASIPPGQTANAKVTHSGLVKGQYKVYVVVDPKKALGDSDRTNNARDLSFEVKERIDLIVATQGIFFSKNTLAENQSMQIRVGVYNAEAAEAKDAVVRVYDGDPKSGGKQIGTDLKVTVPGYKSVYTAPLTFTPTGKAGTRFVYVVVDPDKKLSDINRNNNFAIRTMKLIGLPNLTATVSDITFSPRTPEEGDNLRVYLYVRNKGQANSTGYFNVRVYDQDPKNPAAKVVANIRGSNVNVNSYTRPYFNYYTGQKTGTVQFWFVIDSENVIQESNEKDNAVNTSIIVRAASRPDMTVASTDISFSPAAPTSGSTISVRALIRNLVSKAATNVLVRFHLGSPNSTNKIGETTIASLAGKGSAAATISWSVPASRLDATVYVVVDPLRRISEKNESNNQASRYVKFQLATSATPTGFKVTAQGKDTLAFQWQPGSGAGTVGIKGYRVYCNGGLMNPPTNVTSTATVTASSQYNTTSYKFDNVKDNNYSTAWRPKQPATVTNRIMNNWLEFTFPKAIPISGVMVWFQYSTSYRRFKIQYASGSSWVDLGSGTSGYQHERFFAPVTTNKIRLLVDVHHSSNRYYYYAGVRDVRIYQTGMISGNSWSISKIVRGDYRCHVVGLTTPLLATGTSNEDTASLGDMTPPPVPLNVKVTNNASSYQNVISWSPANAPDIAGYRAYASNQDVAHSAKGATIIASSSTSYYPYRAIDGSPSYYGYIRLPGYFLVQLKKTYSINRLVLRFHSTHRVAYKVEISTDGKNYTMLAERTKTQVSGVQEIPLSKAVSARYIKITPTSSSYTYIYLYEVEAYTKELSPLLNDKIYNYRRYLGSYNAYNSTYWRSGWTYNLTYSNARPRKFIFGKIALASTDQLIIRDTDTSQILARVSGNHTFWASHWITARRYTIHLRPTRFKSHGGFNFEIALERNYTATTSYTHSNVYKDGEFLYAASSLDTSGNESGPSPSSKVTLKDTIAPPPPANLKAQNQFKQVTLTWTNRPARDQLGFYVYRDGKRIANVSNLTYRSTWTFVDTNVTNGVTYKYQVSAYDMNGNESAKIGPVDGTPTGIDLTIVTSGAFSDVFFTPQNPSVYESAVVAVLVRNIGTQDAPKGVLVEVYDGDPGAGGVSVGSITLSDPVPAGGRAIGTLTWNLKNVKPGLHKVYAVIDPKNVVKELSVTNNKAFREMPVHADRFLDTKVNSVDAKGFPVIELFMRVRDANGGGLTGLDERNFVVHEDKKLQKPIKVLEISKPSQGPPTVDIVFVIDTSGSMNDEWRTICAVISDIRDLLLAYRVDLKYTVYSLGARKSCGTLMSQVIWRGKIKSAHSEDWGPGGVWAVLKHPWRKGAARIVIPISDEGAYAGSGWSSEDTETVNESIKVAKDANPQVKFFPFWGKEVGPITSTNVIAKEMRRLAQATGGKAFPFLNATQVVQAIVDAALGSVSDYKITYTTNNPTRDGTLRKVDVETNFNISKGKANGEYKAPYDPLPDLTFAGEVTFTPSFPLVGQRTLVSAKLRNNGGVDASNVVVYFYSGTATTRRLLGQVKVALVKPGQEIPVAIQWQALPGKTNMILVADPNNTIKESIENNNTVAKTVTLPGSLGIELEVSTFDLTMLPKEAVRGNPVQFLAEIHNIGPKEAKNVLVSFFNGDPAKQGKFLGSAVIASIPGHKSQFAKITYTVDKNGIWPLHVVVDPYNVIPDDLKDNNRANRDFTIGHRGLLLSVKTDKTDYPADTDVKIAVGLINKSAGLWSGTGEVWIEDEKDNPVKKVGDFQVKDLRSVGEAGWPYRIPLRWVAPATGAKDVFIGANLDFTAALQQIKVSGKSVDVDSIRVVSFDQVGKYLGQVPFKFTKGKGFDAATAAKGKLLTFIKGSIPKGQFVTLHVLFDVVGGSSPKTPAPIPLPRTGPMVGYIDDTGKVYVRKRSVDGTFGAEQFVFDLSTSTDRSRGLVMGDFNNDGIVDLIAPSPYRRSMYFYPGTTTGKVPFDQSKAVKVYSLSYSYYVMSIRAADINKDGNLDIIYNAY